LTHLIYTGLGLSCFGSVLQEIFYFKPQTIYVSVVFLSVLAYILGEFMALVIPRKGAIGRFLNPGPFNMKEHASITLGVLGALEEEVVVAGLSWRCFAQSFSQRLDPNTSDASQPALWPQQHHRLR